MQSQQENTLQRRIPSAHSRRTASSSSLTALDIDSQQHQYEAQPSISRRPSQRQESAQGSSATPASQLTKLDGVLYHFYTTTANLVIQSRLAHLRPSLLATPFDSVSTEHKPPPATGSSPQAKLSRWFGLHIPETDLFKEELRLWRSVTSLLGLDSNTFDASPPQTPSKVPELIIEVLLDLSDVSTRHEVLLVTRSSTTASAPHGSTSDSRTCIDGRRPGEHPPSEKAQRPQRIVLERWRLRFNSTSTSPAMKDLSVFYKRSVVHFRALFTLLCALPANRLCAKLETLKTFPASDSPRQTSQHSFPSLAARQDMGKHDAEMTVGCRLSMSEKDDSSDPVQADAGTPEEIAVSLALPPEQNLTRFDADESESSGPGQTESRGHYSTRTMAPIDTPIGQLELSVTYRTLTGFSVEDAESLRTAEDIQVDLDEDYFKAVPFSSEDSHPIATSTSPSVAVASSDLNARKQPEPQSGTSQSRGPAQQRMGGISAARPATLAAQRSTSDASSSAAAGAPPTSVETAVPGSPANASVFSTSGPGRPTAGLASLRRTSSNKSNLSLVSPAHPSAAPSSPALAAALSAEPAFAVPGSVRRPSTSERRLRSLSGLSSGRPSPPVSPAATNFELPEQGSSVPRSTSAAFSTSATGRSISTRTTSGFSGMNATSQSSQPRPSVSFSPSSSSPLAQQMSMHGARPSGAANAASGSSFRSASGSGLRSSTSGSGVLTTPSLRSVFQSYVPRSLHATTSSISRTPPTSTSAITHGSYSPSNLGTGLRSSSIRRYSNTSDAGSGSAFGGSVTSSSAAAAAAGAKPQMIKRYSTNFSYRQNRERGGIYGSSLGSEGSGSLGAGGEPSSYPRFGGAGSSLSSAYGRSWVIRMEQRQGLGTGGAFARTASLDDATAASNASASSRYRPLSSAGGAQMGGLTPSPKSHDEDIDDLVRLLETRPAFGTSSMGKLTSLRNERRNAPGLSSTPEELGMTARPGHPIDALSESVQSSSGKDRTQSLSGSGLRSGIRTANPMSRSQLDDLLSRMAESVGMLSTKEPGSSTSGETASDVASLDDRRSHAAQQPGPTSLPLNRAQIASSIGKGRGSPAIEADRRIVSPGSLGRGMPSEAGMAPHGAVGQQQMRAYGTTAVRTETSSRPPDYRFGPSRDSATIPASTSAGPPSSSTGSLEPSRVPDYEAEGDLIFKVDGQQEYNPEDELPGEMEMMPEEGASTARPTDPGATGVEGGIGATLPVGAHREGRAVERVRSGPMNDWHVAERWQRERAEEAERRRADAEMSRNFGQEVGASTRGRGSHSPWRATPHSTSAAATTDTPMSLQSQPAAGTSAMGFRSSSTRPFTGLVGVGNAYAPIATRLGRVPASGAGDDGRRGYGVSAPSTQFHFQPSHGGASSRPAANSYPASRDEQVYDDEEEEEES